MDVFGWYLGVFLGSPSISPKNAINLQISLLLMVEESSRYRDYGKSFKMPKECPDALLGRAPEKCQKHVKKMSGKCPGHFQDVRKMSKKCPKAS